MKKKKLISMLLIGSIIASIGLAGCGNKTETTNKTTNNTEDNTTEDVSVSNDNSDNEITDTIILEKNAKIPKGCKYVSSDGTEYKEGENMPDSSAFGDSFITNDYVYNRDIYSWIAKKVLDKSKAEYEPICEMINGEAVTSMYETFNNCINLEKAPKIPQSIISMNNTFYKCTSLTEAPEIPESVKEMNGTFASCTNLTVAPVIPESVTKMNDTFFNCKNLQKAPIIPSGVTDINNIFNDCINLKGDVIINTNIDLLDGLQYSKCFNNCAQDSEHAIVLKGICPCLEDIKVTGYNDGQYITIEP